MDFTLHLRQRGSATVKQILLGILFSGLFLSGIWLSKLIWYKPFNVDHFYNRVFVGFALESPELMTQVGMFPRWLGYNDELGEISVQSTLDGLQDLRGYLEMSQSYDPADLTETQRLSQRIFEFFIESQVASEAFAFYDYPVNQMFGAQSNLPTFMIETHPITDEGTAEDYIARLNLFQWKFDGLLESLRYREERQIIPPRFVIDRVLTEMDAFVDQPAEEHPLYTSFVERLAEIDEPLPEDRVAELDAQVLAAIEGNVYPAYRELIEYFEALRLSADDRDGVWKLPDGDAYYASQLRQWTTTDMSADEIHQIGLDEVARIRGEMLDILHGEGYDGDDLGAMMQALGEEERFTYADEDGVRDQILADYQTIIDEVSAGLDGYFDQDTRPEAGVEVRRIPEFKEETAPGAYYNPPARDGSRPGLFYANLRSPAEIPRYSMRTLAYHEAVPGHHFQVTINQELEGIPIFRTFSLFGAYTEGWALYAERLAWEAGFEDDPFDNLGRLQAEIFRGVRLVVDTGIHSQRWTRQEAIDYMMANTGMPESEVVSEVERYIVLPGQATSYKVGMMKFLELRAIAQAALGDDFDIHEFHSVVLRNGAVPLSVLEDIVMEWIASKQV
jgi:uncharacterized protein (DUF885 family)